MPRRSAGRHQPLSRSSKLEVIHVCMHAWMHVGVCLSVYVGRCMSVGVCLSVYVGVCRCMSTYVDVCQCMMYVYMYVCLSVCMYVCFHVCIYVCNGL